jgi:hypothetical protein
MVTAGVMGSDCPAFPTWFASFPINSTEAAGDIGLQRFQIWLNSNNFFFYGIFENRVLEVRQTV